MKTHHQLRLQKRVNGGPWLNVSDHHTYVGAQRGKLRARITSQPGDEYRIIALVDTDFTRRHYCRGWLDGEDPRPLLCSQSAVTKITWLAGEPEPEVTPPGWYAPDQCASCHEQETRAE